MKEFFLQDKIIVFLISQILSGLVFGFFFWRVRNKYKIKKEHVFNLVFLLVLCGMVAARIIYIIENFDQFAQLSWSIYPFFYEPGAARVWFRQMPWILFKFWDGELNYFAVHIGSILCTLIFIKIKKLPATVIPNILKALAFSQILLISGTFIKGLYIGKPTELFFGIIYPFLDDTYRWPIQIFEIIAILGILLLYTYLRKIGKIKGFLGLYLFLFSSLEIIMSFFVEGAGNKITQVNVLQIIYLLLAFVGIVVFLFTTEIYSKKQKTIQQPSWKRDFVTSQQTPSESQFRTYKSSYSSFRSTKPNFFQWLKRKFSKSKV